jgi:hypothetical protein
MAVMIIHFYSIIPLLIPLFGLCKDEQAAGLDVKEISGNVVIITFGSMGLQTPEDTPG